MFEWKFHTAKLFHCLVCCYQYLACNWDLLTNGMFGYAFSVYEFRVHYLHIPREAGPFVATRTGMVDHFWLPKIVSRPSFGC